MIDLLPSQFMRCKMPIMVNSKYYYYFLWKPVIILLNLILYILVELIYIKLTLACENNCFSLMAERRKKGGSFFPN